MKVLPKKLLFPMLGTAALLLFAQCKEGTKKDETPAQMQEVIAIHDEVMPKMRVLGRLVEVIKPMADTASADSPYRKRMEDLQAAYHSMNDWMQGFGRRFTYEEINQGKALSPQKQKWLDEEEVKVKKMRDQVNESIEAARELLKKE